MRTALARLPKDRVADVAAILSLAIGLFLVALVAVPMYRIASNPELTTGTVTDKYMIDGGSEGPDSFTVRYSFKTSSGREYSGSVGVDQRNYERASPGNTLEVQYAADDPSNNRAARAGVVSVHVEAAAVVVMMLFFFGYLGPWRWFLRWRGKPDPALRW
jgi:cytochrome c oxidase assembly protein Cox11